MKKLDLTGQKFGMLTVIKIDEKNKSQKTKWICKCDCGNYTSVATYNLKSGHTKSCGCLSKKQSAVNGLKSLEDLSKYPPFGRLKAVKYHPNTKKWECICECGNKVYASVDSLKRGYKKSCGCLVTLDKANEKNIVDGTNIGSIKNKTISSNNKTGVRGVHFCKSRQKYVATIGFKGKQYTLCVSKDFKECVRARKKAEEKIYGEFLEEYETQKKSGKF